MTHPHIWPDQGGGCVPMLSVCPEPRAVYLLLIVRMRKRGRVASLEYLE